MDGSIRIHSIRLSPETTHLLILAHFSHAQTNRYGLALTAATFFARHVHVQGKVKDEDIVVFNLVSERSQTHAEGGFPWESLF